MLSFLVVLFQAWQWLSLFPQHPFPLICLSFHLKAHPGGFGKSRGENLHTYYSFVANVANDCKSSSLPPNTNVDKASFSDIVKNVPHSPCLLIQEAPWKMLLFRRPSSIKMGVFVVSMASSLI